MALLQVRDFPQETYQILARVAKEQNRTVPQQVIFLLSSISSKNVVYISQEIYFGGNGNDRNRSGKNAQNDPGN